MTIPPELLAELDPLTVLALAAITVLWRIWRESEHECDQCRAERSADALTAASALTEQRLVGERALAQIAFREFERDQAKALLERCEQAMDRERERRSNQGRADGRA